MAIWLATALSQLSNWAINTGNTAHS